MRKLLIVLGVLLVVVLALDRVALVVATRQVDQRIEREVGGPVHTSIEGFPFLPSALRRTLPQVQVLAAQLVLSSSDLTVRDVDFTFTTVRVQGDNARARQLHGSFVVPYAEVERRAGRPRGSLRGGEDGLLRIDQQGNVPANPLVPSGSQLVSVVARPQVSSEGSAVVAQLVPISVEVAGRRVEVSASWAQSLARSLTYQVSLRQLPRGMQVGQVQARPQGLWVQVSGSDVSLSGW